MKKNFKYFTTEVAEREAEKALTIIEIEGFLCVLCG